MVSVVLAPSPPVKSGGSVVDVLLVEVDDELVDVVLGAGAGVEATPAQPSLTGEAVSALLGLGVAEVNARRAVDQALIRLGEEADLSAVIRAALQELGR